MERQGQNNAFVISIDEAIEVPQDNKTYAFIEYGVIAKIVYWNGNSHNSYITAYIPASSLSLATIKDVTFLAKMPEGLKVNYTSVTGDVKAEAINQGDVVAVVQSLDPNPLASKDISIEQFKEWFPKAFLSQLTNFYSCGNYGDPAFAKDCLEIYSYVRECNPTTRLALHTNGGMRNPDWWSKLAKVLGSSANSEVVFAVDGFKDKHELYRRNTNFDKVIENMTAFIEAGGRARVDSLVFAHNEHDVEELEQYLNKSILVLPL